MARLCHTTVSNAVCQQSLPGLHADIENGGRVTIVSSRFSFIFVPRHRFLFERHTTVLRRSSSYTLYSLFDSVVVSARFSNGFSVPESRPDGSTAIKMASNDDRNALWDALKQLPAVTPNVGIFTNYMKTFAVTAQTDFLGKILTNRRTSVPTMFLLP